MTTPSIILASQSPRRRELLALVGVAHSVVPADVDERVLPGEEPAPHAERLARSKATAISAQYPHSFVIGSDTIVVIDGDILGKPTGEAHAAEMLRRLSGRTHSVITAIAVATLGHVISGVEVVEVTFRPLSTAQIASYIATGEPMDKAGGYGIQGFGATIVERIHGDYFAVMGLPLGRMMGLLRDVGLEYDFGRFTRAPDAIGEGGPGA